MYSTTAAFVTRLVEPVFFVFFKIRIPVFLCTFLLDFLRLPERMR